MANILIKNGRVWDGDRFFFADILTNGDKIGKITENLTPEKGDFVFDAKGMIVTPGLVDAHVHMMGTEPDKFGISADLSTIPFGVTAAADAGGAHACRKVVENHLVKNVTFVRVSIRNNEARFEETEKKLALYGDNAIGLKVYFDAASTDVQDIKPLETVCNYAHKRGLLVMVHCSGSPVPMAQILQTLSPGDILTHAYHGGASTAKDDDFASMIEAKRRGVVIDAGFAGSVHTDFAVFRAAVEKGVLPDTISTDITRASAYKRGGRYGMNMCMNMARAAGMDEESVLRCVTSTPAKVLGKEGIWGCLKEGGCADIAVLNWENEGFDLTDFYGNNLASDRGYRCKLTVSNGIVVWRD